MNGSFTTIYFMWKREMIRFFRSKSRIVGSLGMPFFLLAVLGTGLNSAVKIPGATGGYLEFIAPGILAMVLLFASVFSGVLVIVDRQFGFLKETLVAPVDRKAIVLGKALGGATAAVFQGILILGISLLLGATISYSGVPAALAVMLVISMAFVSLGVAIASVVDDMHGFQLISNFLIMPMFFLSGALFPFDSAPAVIRLVSYLDPLTYAVDALRFLLVGSSVFPFALSLGVLIALLVATTLVASHLFSKIES